MKWLLKGKAIDQTLVRLAETINRINSCKLVSTFDSRYYISELPFYTDFKLYTFIDHSFTPFLEMKLLDNGINTFLMDGTQNPFIEVNKISPLVLTTENIYQYAMLVLGSIKENDNSYRLIHSIEEIVFSTEPSMEQYQQLESSIRTPKIKKDKESYHIKTTLLFGNAVIKASIVVSLNGRVDIIKEKLILNNMPVSELVLE